MSYNRNEIERLEEERKKYKTIGIVCFLFGLWPVTIYALFKNSKIKNQIKELESNPYSYGIGERQGGSATFERSSVTGTTSTTTTPPQTGRRTFSSRKGGGGQGSISGTGSAYTSNSGNSGNSNNNNFANSADKFKNR